MKFIVLKVEILIFKLPELPYAQDALAPIISLESVEYHYGKHHNAFVTNLNNLIKGTEYERLSLVDFVKTAQGEIFNNAAEVYNHTIYWYCLKPNGGGEPYGEISEAINKNFGSFALFKEKFTNSAITQFGSGWVWLIQNSDGTLAIEQTANSDCPLRKNQIPLLSCDVWEHAYYIDYRDARVSYVKGFWELVNWEFATLQLMP